MPFLRTCAAANVRRFLALLICVTALLLNANAQRALAVGENDVDESENLPPMLNLALRPWTGDFDQMIERSMIRVVIPVTLVTYFADGVSQKGPAYDLVQEFEKYLKKTLGERARDLTMVVIPGRRDRIFDMVKEGQADIAAGIITITEERAKLVDFSPPFRSDIKEVIVTGTDIDTVKSLDDLVGVEIHVRRSTSFWETLQKINEKREERGAEILTVVPADELLNTEDLLEMVGANVIDATVADSPVAEVFARHFEGLSIQDSVPLVEGRSYAWAYRKGDAKLEEALEGFVKTAAKGTLLGNIVLNKYTKNTDWIRNVRAPGEQDKLAQMADLFRTYAGQYGFDWLMIAAQGYQESQLDQSKRSHVGAVGVMQVMPATAKDPAVGIPDIENIESNIHAGVKYLNFLRTHYLNDPAISELDRTLLSFAAYNAGPGNLSKARKRAGKLGLNPNVWFDNVEIAMGEAVSREPIIYVRNVFKYYTAFKLIAAENTAPKR